MRSETDFRPYQHQALEFVHRHRRSYLAAKAGAGKTAVALALIQRVLFDDFEARQVLVVCPKRVVRQWAEEARGWTFGRHLRFGAYLGPKPAREAVYGAIAAGEVDVAVVSFEFFPELLKRHGRAFPYGLVVFDEASRLRSGGRQGAVGWKAMNAISAKTDARILLMSGSPRPGTAHELYAPVFLLDQGQRLGRTLGAFRAGYLEPRAQNRHTGQVYSWRCRPGMEQALYGRIADLFFAVAPDLGLASVTVDRWVDLPQPVSEACAELYVEQVVSLDELEVVAASAGTAVGKLHQLGQGAVFDANGDWQQVHDEKLDALEELLDEIDAPAVVCFWYTHDRERLLARFPHAVDITTDDGLAAAKRGKVRLALLHPASAGHGIDGLQHHFSAMVWFAVPASFELYDQACRRLVRSGQRETVQVFRIVARDNIVDARILERLLEKEAEQDEFIRYVEVEHGIA